MTNDLMTKSIFAIMNQPIDKPEGHKPTKWQSPINNLSGMRKVKVGEISETERTKISERIE